MWRGMVQQWVVMDYAPRTTQHDSRLIAGSVNVGNGARKNEERQEGKRRMTCVECEDGGADRK